MTNLTKRYDEATVAVDGIDLTVQAGEFVTLLGPSGSGKTTTLMAIAGFVEPTNGIVRIGGESMEGTPPHKRAIGVVFQNYALFPHMTVRDNVAFPLKVRRWDRDNIQQAVQNALALVHLETLGDRYPGQLSGGQQQRVALARATVFGPKLLLMDEPLGALDRQLRQTMQFELQKIQRTLGVTVISVTHDQEEALTTSDRVVIMNEGKIVQAGSPLEVYEQPRTRFVAGFVGETNLLSGVVSETSPEEFRIEINEGLGLVVRGKMQTRESAVVSIRPESWTIRNTGDDSARNTLMGVVRSKAYTGGAMRYSISIGDKDIVAMNRDRLVYSSLSPGDEVHLQVDPSDIAVVEILQREAEVAREWNTNENQAKTTKEK